MSSDLLEKIYTKLAAENCDFSDKKACIRVLEKCFPSKPLCAAYSLEYWKLHKKFTVVVFDNNGGLDNLHVLARNPHHALFIAANMQPTAMLICTLNGHINQDEGIYFPGARQSKLKIF